MDGKSEVIRIKRQIELEYEACQRIFKEPAITSCHAFIEARQARIGDCFEELKQYMTVEEAMQIFLSVSEGIGHGSSKQPQTQTPIVQTSPETKHYDSSD